MDDDWQNLAPNSLGELAPVTAATLWKTHDDTKQGGMGKNISKTKRASPVGGGTPQASQPHTPPLPS
jgi:hypothetical protein